MSEKTSWEEHRDSYSTLQEEYELPDLDTVVSAFSLSPEDVDPDENRLLPSLVDAVVQNVLSLAQDMQNHLTGRTLLYQGTNVSLADADQDRLQQVYVDLAEEAWNARAAKYKTVEEQAEWLEAFVAAWNETYRDEVIWFCEYVADQWSDVEEQEPTPTAENPLFG